MKKIIAVSVMILFLITGCGNNNTAEKKAETLTYKEYTTLGVSYELPSDWIVEQEADGSLSVTNFDVDSFSVMLTDGVSESTFEYFCEEYMANYIENMDYTTLNSFNKTSYASLDAYDYDAETIIQGETSPVKITILNKDDYAIVFNLVIVSDDYDFDAIYSHMLSSLEVA